MARFKYTNSKLMAYQSSLPARGTRTVQKTGRIAERSARDFAPVDTGNLKSKIHFDMDGPAQGTLHSDAEYSLFVNAGTYKMAPQPFFEPGMERARAAFPGIAAQEFKP